MPKCCAVVGFPAEHSLSPALHRAGYASLGLDWSYEAIELEPGALASLVASLGSQWRGLSVTMPHKADAALLGVPDEMVQLVGVANTLIFGEEIRAYNTDVAGFAWALAGAGVTSLESATILGNGATARSILVALAGLGASKVHVVVRSRGRAKSLNQLAERLDLVLVEQSYADPLPPVDLLASTIPSDAVPPQAALSAPVLFDVVYNPWPTPLAERAKQAGRIIVSGLDLLIGQAIDQFALFTGYHLDPEIFAVAGRMELARRARS